MGNSNDEDKLRASTSLPQGSEEQGCSLLSNDSAIDNVPGISQSHNREIAPSGRNLMTSSSQINRPNSGFLSPYAAPFNPISRSRVGNNIDQPPLDFNFRVPMFGPNQGAVSLNSPEMLEERHLTSDSGSNTNVEVNTNLLGNDLATIIFGFSGNALVDTLPFGPVAPFDSAACLFSCHGLSSWFHFYRS